MATECVDKSPVVNQGRTFVTKFGNIKLNKVYDNSSGSITVTPNGYPPITRSTVDSRLEDFYGVMTVKTNFFTLAGMGAHFWVCGIFEDPPLTCEQVFKMQDQHGNPLNGNVAIGTTNITVLGTGSTLLEQGVPVEVIASYIDFYEDTRTVTPCQQEEVFEFWIPDDEPDPDPDPDPEPPEPIPPTNLKSECNGTKVTLSWNPVYGADFYSLRVNLDESIDFECGTAPGDFCVDLNETSYTFDTTPGKWYNWWVHTRMNDEWSDAAMGDGFVCKPPEPDEDGKISICQAFKLIFPSLPPLPEKMCFLRVPYPKFVDKSKESNTISTQQGTHYRGRVEERPMDDKAKHDSRVLGYENRY